LKSKHEEKYKLSTKYKKLFKSNAYNGKITEWE